MDYPGAAKTYQVLIGYDDTLVRPKRELGRVYYADHKYDAAHMAFKSVSAPDPDVEFRQTLQVMAGKAPQHQQAVEGLAAGLLPGPNFARNSTSYSRQRLTRR